ncbi:MAG: CPBP family intramembrane metalloprotease [Cyclobacteriaceae bacterium]
MKKIKGYIFDYIKEYFDPKLYGYVAIFLAISIALNYWLDFEDGYIDKYTGQWIKWLWMFLFMIGPFLVVCFILKSTGKSTLWLKSKEFWVTVIIGFIILSGDRAFSAYRTLRPHLEYVDAKFVSRSVQYASSFITIVIPMIIFFWLKERKGHFYGLRPRSFDPKPYLILLAMASLFLFIGSFMSDMQAYYPRFLKSGGDAFAERHEFPKWVSLIIYEISYGLDFISVEVFFRGFLVLAFLKTVGPHVLLPMAATYCYLHFGKPIGESISSIFGGYILGIISMRTENVWGGILVHVGVAWLMEIIGYLQGHVI